MTRTKGFSSVGRKRLFDQPWLALVWDSVISCDYQSLGPATLKLMSWDNQISLLSFDWDTSKPQNSHRKVEIFRDTVLSADQKTWQ